jgi:sulfur carrier protein ThiS adenylyltransferase
MDTFEQGLARYLSPEALARIKGVRVGVAGAGGLGSNCAQLLVRSGFSDFVIVDSDCIEASNLNRQFYFSDQIGQAKAQALRKNLLAINPGLRIQAIVGEVTPENVRGLFSDRHVVIEAFDRPQAKAMLVADCLDRDVFLVAASGLAGYGDADAIATHRIRDNFFMVGDLKRGIGPDMPPLAPRVAVAAAKQADLVLGFALGRTA